MYQGKHLAPKAKKKIVVSRRKRKITLFLSLVLILGGAISSTMAYFTDKTASDSSISLGQVSCSVSQNGNSYTVTNDGTVSANIRATVVVNWVDDNDALHWSKPEATVSFGDGWTEKGGFYYYHAAVGAGEAVTGPAVTVSGTAPEGYRLQIQALAEAIQENAAADAWGYSPSGN